MGKDSKHKVEAQSEDTCKLMQENVPVGVRPGDLVRTRVRSPSGCHRARVTSIHPSGRVLCGGAEFRSEDLEVIARGASGANQ